MFFNIGILKYLVIFKEKHLYWSSFLITLQVIKFFMKKRLQHKCFFCEYCVIFTPLVAVSINMKLTLGAKSNLFM